MRLWLGAWLCRLKATGSVLTQRPYQGLAAARRRAGSEVAGGRLEVAVRYQGVHVYSKSGSLCESVACPVPEGKSTLVMQQKMPHFAPPVSCGSHA